MTDPSKPLPDSKFFDQPIEEFVKPSVAREAAKRLDSIVVKLRALRKPKTE